MNTVCLKRGFFYDRGSLELNRAAIIAIYLAVDFDRCSDCKWHAADVDIASSL